MLNMNFRRPSVPDKDECKYLQLQGNGCLTAPLRHLMNQSCLRSDYSLSGGEGLCGFGLFKLPLLQYRLRYASFLEAERLSVFEESCGYAHQLGCDID